MAFTWEQFHMKCSIYQFIKWSTHPKHFTQVISGCVEVEFSLAAVVDTVLIIAMITTCVWPREQLLPERGVCRHCAPLEGLTHHVQCLLAQYQQLLHLHKITEANIDLTLINSCLTSTKSVRQTFSKHYTCSFKSHAGSKSFIIDNQLCYVYFQTFASGLNVFWQNLLNFV